MNEFRKRLYELLTKYAGVDPILAEEIVEDKIKYLIGDHVIFTDDLKGSDYGSGYELCGQKGVNANNL